ncbi:unnamed protein product [Phaeothamnion confervicola]
MFAGALSRSIAQTAMQPANVIKTLLQGKNTAVQLNSLSWRSWRVLTRGAGAQFVLSLPHGAFNFATLEAVRGYAASLFPGNVALGPVLDFVSSSVATTICSVVSTPQMVLTDRIMAGIYPSLAAGVRTISKESGLKGFYAGWFPALVQKIPSYGLTWVLFEQFKAAHRHVTHRSPTAAENFGLGAAAAAATVCMMIPLDTLKTRIVTQQPAMPGGPLPYAGIVDCARKMVAEEGVGSFYRALWPRLAAVVPMVGVNFGVYETLRAKLLARRAAANCQAGEHENWVTSPRMQHQTYVKDFLVNLSLLDEELL